MATLYIRGSRKTKAQQHEVSAMRFEDGVAAGYAPSKYAVHEPARFAFRMGKDGSASFAGLLNISFESRDPADWLHYGSFANTDTACWGAHILHDERMYDGVKIAAYENGEYVLTASPAAT